MIVVFIDRDGVINEYPGDNDYVKSWEEFRFLPGVMRALKELTDKKLKIFIISNQAGVSKGLFSQEALDTITRNMLGEFKKEHIDISGVYYCIHKPQDGCSCRKPKTGLLDEALAQLKKEGISQVDLSRSYFIGDTIRDIQTGRQAHLSTILVFSGKEKPENKDKWQIQPDKTFPDLLTAVEKEVLRA